MKTKVEIPDYVFRSTTRNFSGRPNQEYTCTTKNPIKAVLFALVCASGYSAEAVVYIAQKERLKHLKPVINWFNELEEELAWPLTPTEFISLTEGYINARELARMLNNKGKNTPSSVTLGSLSQVLEEAPKISKSEIKGLVKEILNSIVK